MFDGHDNVCTITGQNGKDEAEEFLTTLDRVPQARFNRYLERLRDGHHVKSPEHMRQLKGVNDPQGKGAQVHELKVNIGAGYRLYLIKFNGRWFATHGGKKVSERAVIREIRRAFAIFWHE